MQDICEIQPQHLQNLQMYCGYFYDALKRYEQAQGPEAEAEAAMWVYNSVGYVQTQLVIFENSRTQGPLREQCDDKRTELSVKLNNSTAWCTKPLAIQMKFAVDQMLDGQKEVLNQKYGNFGDAGGANM